MTSKQEAMAMQEAAATSATPFRPLRASLLFVAGALLILAVPSARHPLVYAMATVIFFLLVVPAWYRWHDGRFDAFETLHVIGFRYFVFFGLGGVWAARDPYDVAYDQYLADYIPTAALYCALGYGTFLAGYFAPWFRSLPRRKTEEYPRGLLFILVPLGLGFMGSMAEVVWQDAYWRREALPIGISPIMQLAPLFLFAWALSWLVVLSGRATRAQRYLHWAVIVPATVLILLLSLSDKSLAMTLAGLPLAALWYAKRKLPWRSVLTLVLVLVFVIFPFFNSFRVLDPHLPLFTRIELTTQAISNWTADEYHDASIGMVKYRMAMINSVAVVIRDVGRWVPFANGETLYLPALAFFVPRALWPDKPVFTMGRDFGETFRVVHILDTQTSIAVTVPGELYWNHGLPGILIGMALWGLALRLLYRRYGASEGVDPIQRAIHLVLMMQFVHFGGGLAAQVVTIVRTLIVLEAFRLLARRMELTSRLPLVRVHPKVE